MSPFNIEQPTSVQRIIDSYDKIEADWADSAPDYDSYRHPFEHEDHDDALTSLLHELVDALKTVGTE